MQEPKMIKYLGFIYPKETSKYKRVLAIYECIQCGEEHRANVRDIKLGKSLICKKCQGYNARVIHNHTKHRLYGTWKQMLLRCNSDNHKKKKYYKDKGIIVCDRWLDFQNFIDDMYPSFKEGLTLDRIDANGNYEPSNCRWATRLIQSTNTKLLRIDNTSGYRGVSFIKSIKKYESYIDMNKKRKRFGYFIKAIDAAKAREKYIIENSLPHKKNFE